jgi:hypothetical protein
LEEQSTEREQGVEVEAVAALPVRGNPVGKEILGEEWSDVEIESCPVACLG